jgi:glycosyltransferase involved in cell wall biosynthesis
MRILYVVHEFFPSFYGGTERYVLNLAHQMQQMGHRPEVLTYALAESDEALTETIAGLPARRYAHEGVPVVSLRHRERPPDLDLGLDDPRIAAALDAVLELGSYDVVHVAHPMRLGAGLRSLSRRSAPLVLTLTDFWLPCPRGRFQKLDLSPCGSPDRGDKCCRQCAFPTAVQARYDHARELFDAADAVIAPSELVIEVFRRQGWQRAITRINHGVECSPSTAVRTTPPRDGRVRLGYTGVVAPFKGVDVLIKSFMAVDARNLTLAIHGSVHWDGTFRLDLDHWFASDPRIRLMNRFAHEDLPEVMAGIDVMVVPSTTLDSYGLVAAESLAFSVPVIASDMVGAAHELVRDGENGFLYPADEPDRLRALIERVAREPELVARLRAGIRPPPRIEEEAFQTELVYRGVARTR